VGKLSKSRTGARGEVRQDERRVFPFAGGMVGCQGLHRGGKLRLVEDVFLERRNGQHAWFQGAKIQFRVAADARRRDPRLGHLKRHSGRRVQQDRLETF